MTYQINFLADRPDDETVAALGQLGVSIISDAMGRYGCLDSAIKPLADSMGFAGPAFTVQTYRADNLMIHLALEMAQPGDVLVVDACGFADTGLWGELMTRMAVKKGLAGIVIDGAVRDKLELIAAGFPVFARSICPMGGVKTTPGSVNIPVACAGVTIAPGDVVVGDANGVVAVPAASAEAVLARAQKVKANEERIIEEMDGGRSLFEILGLEAVLQGHGLHAPNDPSGDAERLVALLNTSRNTLP